MINILRKPDDIKIECEEDNADCTVETEIRDEKLYIYVTAADARPSFICLRWNYRVTEPTRIMGDKWERSYGDMEWHSLNGEIFMPWYFLANSGDKTAAAHSKAMLSKALILRAPAAAKRRRRPGRDNVRKKRNGKKQNAFLATNGFRPYGLRRRAAIAFSRERRGRQQIRFLTAAIIK